MIEFIIGVFAVYRLALLIYEEEGPFDLVGNLRRLVTENPWKFNPGFDGDLLRMLGKMLECFRCVSLWTALPVGMYLGWSSATRMMIYWLAFSGAAIWLHERQ